MQNQDQIINLSNEVLLNNLNNLSKQENEATVEILLHLGEVERRELFLAQGYGSLFSYCTKGKLRYAETAAMRRILAARAIKRFPEIVPLLISKELSLTTLSLVAKMLSDTNVQEVLGAVKGKSRKEVDEFMARQRPCSNKPKERIKPIVVALPATLAGAGSLFRAGGDRGSHGQHQQNSSIISTALGSGKGAAQGSLGQGHPGDSACSELVSVPLETVPAAPVEDRYELRFSVSKHLMSKVEEVRVLLSGKFPKGATLEGMLEAGLEELLEKHSPKRREERREKRKAKAEVQSSLERSDLEHSDLAHSGLEHSGLSKKSEPEQNKAPRSAAKAFGRHIPLQLRDEVYKRDKGCCAFVSRDGVRCLARHDLEIHHIIPHAMGGLNEIDNLSLRCRLHNYYQAKLDFGAAQIEARIAAMT